MSNASEPENQQFEAFKQSNPEFVKWLMAREQQGPLKTVPTYPTNRPALQVSAATSTSIGINYLHNYLSSGANTCGQAAIATLLDYHNIQPDGFPQKTGFDPNDGKLHWNSDQVIACIAQNYGPDVLWGALMLGTAGYIMSRGSSTLL